MAEFSMDLDQLSRLLFDLVEENAGSLDLASFFLLMQHLGLKGLGVGGGGDVNNSGEVLAMHHIRQTLEQRYPGSPLTIFDVGANVGGFLGKLNTGFADVPRRIHSFEPSPRTFAMLSQAIAERAIADVEPHNFGFGKEDATLELFSDRAGSAIASLYQRRMDHFSTALDQKETVTLRTIDGFCTEQGIERIHYLKLDVEGHELDCLAGAKAMIDAGAIDVIQFEFGGANIDSRTFFQDFWYLLKDYKISRIMKGGLYHIKKYTEYEEIFVVQNYVAERL